VATPLADIARLAEDAIGGGALVRGLPPTERFVERALIRLNDVAPRSTRIKVTGTGVDEYTLSSPWLQDQSRVDRVLVYAAGDFGEFPSELDPQSYVIGRTSADADQIRFVDGLATSDIAELHVHVPYTLTSTATTLGANDYSALGDLAGALKLESAAAALLGVVQQGSDEDVANLNTTDRAEQMRTLASGLRKRFDAHFGVKTGADGVSEQGACAFADVDPHTGYDGGRWHTHSRRGTGL